MIFGEKNKEGGDFVKLTTYLVLVLALSSLGIATIIASNLMLEASPIQLPKLVDSGILNWGDPIGGGGGGGGAPGLNATFVGSNLIYF